MLRIIGIVLGMVGTVLGLFLALSSVGDFAAGHVLSGLFWLLIGAVLATINGRNLYWFITED